MTKTEFLSKLDWNPEDYRFFHAIPKEHRSPETAITWMTTLNKRLDITSTFAIQQIPDDLKSQPVLLTAVDINPQAIEFIKASESADYLEIVLAAVHMASQAFRLMDDSYKTEAVLDALIADHVFMDFETGHLEWIRPLLNQSRIDQIATYSFWFALDIGLEKVSWEVVKDHLKKTPGNYDFMDKKGLLGYLSKMLKENEWPDSQRNFTYKPLEGLADGVRRFMRSDSDSMLHYLYKAYVMTYPVAEVIAAMKTPARREVLLGLYPTDVLRQHAHGDRNLRGRILEQEIGL